MNAGLSFTSMVRAADTKPTSEISGKTDARGVFKIVLPNRGPFTVIAEKDVAAKGDAKSGRSFRSPLAFPPITGDFLNLTLREAPVVARR